MFGPFASESWLRLARRLVEHLAGAAARAGARESCADFRAAVWDFNPNRSSLEPSLGFAAIAGPPCIVDRVTYVQALEEPKWDPKRLWRTRLDDGPASRPQTGPQKS